LPKVAAQNAQKQWRKARQIRNMTALIDSEISFKINKAADVLWSAWLSGIPVAPVRGIMDGVVDLELAYAVQEINCKRSINAGRKLIGRKIGLTSLAMQGKLGVSEPTYGMLFAGMDHSMNQPIPLSALIQPKIEAEIALIMKQSVTNHLVNEGEFARCVDYACAAFEIVDSRTMGWDNTLFDTIADNVSARMFVLGDEKRALDEFDLVHCKMTMTCNGAQISEGQGVNCYGSPLFAGAWLARRMVLAGRPLQSGDVILTGALGPVAQIQPNTHFVASIEGLGSVTASFS
jgi:2-keto-4-pentenoate hydratase